MAFSMQTIKAFEMTGRMSACGIPAKHGGDRAFVGIFPPDPAHGLTQWRITRFELPPGLVDGSFPQEAMIDWQSLHQDSLEGSEDVLRTWGIASSMVDAPWKCGLAVMNPNRDPNGKLDDDWDQRLSRIEWSEYHTAYGVATNVAGQLRRLRSTDENEALSAAHDLWCGLCHQHVQIGSAALPAFPFLMEVLTNAGDQLKVEILDILLGLAITSNPARIEEFAKTTAQADLTPLPWVSDVRSALVAELPRLLPLRTHTHGEVSHFAQLIVEELWSGDPVVPSSFRQGNVSAPDFYTATADFAKFVVSQGYPSNLLWVEPEDVALCRWNGRNTAFVWKGDPIKRRGQAREHYQNVVAQGTGLAFEARGKTERWTICRVYVPVDADDAQRRMIPPQGVKHSAVVDPMPVVLVENKLRGRILKWLNRNAPPVWD